MVRSHSRSLKLVPFESLGAVSYSQFIVTMAVYLVVCAIYSASKNSDLENWVRGRSRSLKMTQFYRLHMTFYWSAVVTCTMVELFEVIVTLKFGLEVTRGH